MPSPTPLEIATKAVIRLVKEEKSYHIELVSQLARLDKLKNEAATTTNENHSFMVKQEETAIQETRAVFQPLRLRIAAAVEKLVAQIASDEASATSEQLTAARDAVTQGRAIMEQAVKDATIVTA
ncbi:Tubulin binding cofactor A [Ceratocystis platani]|uniref:Tubulin-specific chaperone A n=1 Tax=Ceratocystis fimbriata f. sp. platani TaxID=88771 RepID=A0A0F8CQD9_CERFI|nr:Tubulin binding cofactor A [Ceratocystis platani]